MNRIHNQLMIPPALFLLINAAKARAACPVCTVAVGGMMVLLEKYGVDNTISGVWIGGFILSTTLWAINILNKRSYKFFGMKMVLLLFFYLSLIVPLQYKGIIGIPSKMIWGMDKALLGMLLGGVFFQAAHLAYLKIKIKNNNKPWFPFQRVVMPVLSLAFLSLIFYLISSPKYLWHDIRGYAETPLFWIVVPVVLIGHLLLFRSMDRLPACH
ncbi:MAG: hypothetical protein AAB881_01015 [Patescibacteria group bacterium]